MKNTLKTIGKVAAAIAVAVALPTIANAQLVTYQWVNVSGEGAEYTATGTIQFNNGTLTSYVFDLSDGVDDNTLNPPDPFDFSDNLNYMDITGDASQVGGIPTGTWNTNSIDTTVTYMLSPTLIPLDQLNATDDGSLLAAGYWSEVPEPSTITAGLLLLVPLAVSTLRILRRNGRFARIGQQSGENSLRYPSRIQRRE